MSSLDQILQFLTRQTVSIRIAPGEMDPAWPQHERRESGVLEDDASMQKLIALDDDALWGLFYALPAGFQPLEE